MSHTVWLIHCMTHTLYDSYTVWHTVSWNHESWFLSKILSRSAAVSFVLPFNLIRRHEKGLFRVYDRIYTSGSFHNFRFRPWTVKFKNETSVDMIYQNYIGGFKDTFDHKTGHKWRSDELVKSKPFLPDTLRRLFKDWFQVIWLFSRIQSHLYSMNYAIH